MRVALACLQEGGPAVPNEERKGKTPGIRTSRASAPAARPQFRRKKKKGGRKRLKNRQGVKNPKLAQHWREEKSTSLTD